MYPSQEEEIIKYIEGLENQNEFKSDLISTSAHQMRTSLTANKWALSMILKGDSGPITEEQKELLSKINENNNQLISTISELIDVNHTEETHPKYNFEPINIHEIIEHTIGDFRGESREKNIAISFDETGENHIIVGDKQKIKTVLQALIENALKYSPEGGSIMIHTETKEDEVVISIQDEGIGIPKEEQKNIFQKFYRAENAQREQAVGSGLGLFSSFHIIKAHGGKLWFESEEGVGSTFYISLPFPSDEVIVE